jgi:triacylglycerol lipase
MVQRLGTWLVLLGICAGCASIQPDWQSAGVQAKPARYDDIACQLAVASDCAYDVAQHVDRAGNLDAAFCPQSPYREAYGFLGDFTGEVNRDGTSARDAVFVGTSSAAVIIAFRGTLSLRTTNVSEETIAADWLNDANADLVDSQVGEIHQGFANSLTTLWQPLLDKLKELQRQGKISAQSLVYVTGHSKGGSLADIAAARLKLNGMPIAAVYTFAAARPGGYSFATVYAQQQIPTFRYENENDVVPHLPPDAEEWAVLHATGDSSLGRIPVAHNHYASVGTLRYITDQLSLIEVEGSNAALEQMRRDRFAQTAAASLGHSELLQILVASHSIGPPPLVGELSQDHRYYRAVCTK